MHPRSTTASPSHEFVPLLNVQQCRPPRLDAESRRHGPVPIAEPPAHPGQASLLIADNHPLFRRAVRQAISGLGSLRIAEAGSFAQLSEMFGDSPVELVCLDLALRGLHAVWGLMWLRACRPQVRVIAVSSSNHPLLIRMCMDLGAAGFVSKTAGGENIRNAISTVLQGGLWTTAEDDPPVRLAPDIEVLRSRLAALTCQEMRVLMLLAAGLTNAQAASRLGTTHSTMKAHVSGVMRKLHVASRTQAVIALCRFEAFQTQCGIYGTRLDRDSRVAGVISKEVTLA